MDQLELSHTWPELTTRGTTLFAEAALSFRQNAAVVAIAAQWLW